MKRGSCHKAEATYVNEQSAKDSSIRLPLWYLGQGNILSAIV